MQTVPLGNLKRGIDRTVIRGAGVGNGLYDLTNAYVTISGSVRRRQPFKRVAQLDARTVGLFSNRGKLHTFYTGTALESPLPSLIALHILPPPSDTAATLQAIAFDALYLGRQYVIARWDDGKWWHYWLPSTEADGDAPAWQASHAYAIDAVVQPTTPNGYTYTIANNAFPAAWKPATAYAVGAVVSPTVPNGWKYTCIDAIGDNPSSGTTEPVWPKTDGATVNEDRALQPSAPPTSSGSDGGGGGGGRYGNPGGSRNTSRRVEVL